MQSSTIASQIPRKPLTRFRTSPTPSETLTRTTLRNIVGEMELDATLGSRDVINRRMREVIEEASIGWGVDVTRVELQSIEPPRDIQQSMELQMRAERERRAAVTNAEAGKEPPSSRRKEFVNRRSCGQRASGMPRFSRAKGLAEARLAMAEAEAEAIHKIGSALPEGQAAMYLLGMKYLEALPTLAQGKNSTIFLPAEAAGVIGAIGGLREVGKQVVPLDLRGVRHSDPAVQENRIDLDRYHAEPRRTDRAISPCPHCGEYSFKKLKVTRASKAHQETLGEVWHVTRVCGVCASQDEMGLDTEGEIVYGG